MGLCAAYKRISNLLFRACGAQRCTFFLYAQKEGKEALKGRGISIFPFP